LKSILLATAGTVAMAVAVTVVFRAFPGPRRAAAMMRIFLVGLPVLVGVWAVTPDDLGFLPAPLLAEPRWFDLAACLFFYAAAFGGGLLQLYNLADRGLSLRILADLAGAGDRALTVDELVARYGGGRGLAWMYDKRLQGLTEHRLVVVDGAQVRLTTRGRVCAERSARLRRFLRLPSP
jgi:hypothetical protein